MIGRAIVVTALLAGVATVGGLVPAAWGDPAGTSALTVAKTGTYHYRQTIPAGPAVEGSLVVKSAASGNQTWIRNFGAEVPVSTSLMSYRGSGIYVVTQREQMSGTTISCTFATPLPWPPSPPTVGATFSSHAACNRGAVLNVTGKVAGTAMLSFDGKAVTTAVVESKAVMSVTYLGNRYEINVTQVDWYASSLRMPIQTATHVVIPAQGSATDSTYVLESSKPT